VRDDCRPVVSGDHHAGGNPHSPIERRLLPRYRGFHLHRRIPRRRGGGNNNTDSFDTWQQWQGWGKVGKHAAKAFGDAGWTVRKFDRAKDDLAAAAQAAQVIVNGLNPPNYHNWAGIIPQITRDVIEAAKASKATVILPGNIYNFGVVNGVIDEHTPQRPSSRKGL